MQDLIGRTLGHYRIVEKIGEGGMGEVYRAHDERLDRDVAIKVLHESVAQDADRLARFEREAKAVAKLDHPNILAIHDFGTDQGVTYAVTELLDGQNLRKSIPASGMPWQKVAEMGATIADGLAAANGKGIVHRDLKPENVFVTSDGRVKILDFGLAQVKVPVEEEAETATLTPAGTMPGTVMGTMGYMSPEQLRGEPADARSDIFALGCVLYEMLSGRTAFLRNTTADTVAAILKEESPGLSDSGTTLPVELERLVYRCVEKSPEARFQSASDLAFALRSIPTSNAVPTAAPTMARVSRTLRIGLTLAGTAAVAAAIVGALIILSPGEPDLPPTETIRLTGWGGSEWEPSLSPDGEMVAFVQHGDEGPQLHVMMIGGDETLQIGSGYVPTWSPDGREIAFVRNLEDEDPTQLKGVFVISALGGSERRLAASLAGSAYGLSWSPDGDLLALVDRITTQEPDAIFLLSLKTGEKRRLTRPPDGCDGDYFPKFSRDGREVAFFRKRLAPDSDVFVVASAGGEPRRLTDLSGYMGGLDWSADGTHVIFSTNSLGEEPGLRLWRVPAAGGDPERLTVGEGGGEISISKHGHRLVYAESIQARSDLWRVAIPPLGQSDLAPSRFISTFGYSNYPDYSPDGRRIVFGSTRTQTLELWICDSDGSNPRQLTHSEKGYAGWAKWSPDGRWIVFSSNNEGTLDIYVVASEGGIPRRLTEHDSEDALPSWARDGRSIYFCSNRSGRFEIYRMPATGGDAVTITSNGGTFSHESADEKFLYFSKAFPMSEPLPGIWRMPLSGGDEELMIAGANYALWQVMDDGIYYMDLQDIYEEDLRSPGLWFFDFVTGTSQRITELEGASEFGLAVSPDRRWALYQREENEYDIMLVENFR